MDYTDPSRQDVSFAGPIPEARYTLSLTEKMGFDRTGKANGAGWGEGGWGLEETYLNRLGGRNGFFLHHDGGTPGTAGCIGLQSAADIRELQSLLQHAHESGQSKVNIRVDYPGTMNNPLSYW